MSENNKDSILYWLKQSSGFTGALASGAVGLHYPTIEGVVVGSALGTLITETLQNIGQDMRSRYLSKKEEIRIGSAFFYLLEKFNENADKGLQLRDDGFFDKQGDYNRNDEIVEGLLVIAQKSYEERKVRFISYFYSNILFLKHLDTYHANHYLRMAETMSYRQFCLLAIYYEKEKYGLKVDVLPPISDIDRYDVRAEMFALDDKALLSVHIGVTGSNIRGYPFQPEDVDITDYGKLFYELFDLSKIPFLDILEVAEQIVQPEWFEKLKKA